MKITQICFAKNRIYLNQTHIFKSKHIFKRIAQSIRMLNLPQKESKLIAENKGIKVYKSMSKLKLLSIFNAPEPIKK